VRAGSKSPLGAHGGLRGRPAAAPMPQVETKPAVPGHNPLASLPSILSLRDLRAALHPATRNQHDLAADLLRIDPLTLLRCLRLTGSHLHGKPLANPSVGAVLERLGVGLVRRAFATAAVAPEGTLAVRRLWLHGLATAAAATELAESAGIDPEHAWVLGLLHDLDAWLAVLAEHRATMPSWCAREWLRRWKLPESLLVDRLTAHVLRAPELADPHGLVRTRTDLLIPVAELVAQAADFAHPDASAEADRDPTSREFLLLAQTVRHRVRDTLAAIGLVGAVEPALPQSAVAQADPPPVFRVNARTEGHRSDLVHSLLACNRARSYRAVLTAGMASALRYLDFDRAVVLRWDRASNRCWIRAKHDLARSGPDDIEIVLSETETAQFAAALRLERPICIAHDPDHVPPSGSLLDVLAADAVVAAPVNRIFEVPTFLLLDRTLTARPIDPDEDVRETGALSGVFSLLVDNLFLRMQRIRLQRTAISDPLTRLPNRGAGMLALEHEFASARRDGTPLSVLMIDLDDFKKLNDAHGHMVGDQALQLTAQVLRRTIRQSDVICRYGGEEFLAVLPRTRGEDAAVLATRLYLAVEEAGIELGLPVTVSIGASTLRQDDQTYENLLLRADRALYASKSTGRNRFSLDD
jgi:diguanylate cyclase (GGDEF)-like protein